MSDVLDTSGLAHHGAARTADRLSDDDRGFWTDVVTADQPADIRVDPANTPGRVLGEVAAVLAGVLALALALNVLVLPWT